METIKSITEAFSIQPITIRIMKSNEDYYDKPNACKEIKLETVTIGYKYGNPIEEICYVGYNFEGKKICQYLANTVNVHYKTE